MLACCVDKLMMEPAPRRRRVLAREDWHSGSLQRFTVGRWAARVEVQIGAADRVREAAPFAFTKFDIRAERYVVVVLPPR
jgi:hypothetical protein